METRDTSQATSTSTSTSTTKQQPTAATRDRQPYNSNSAGWKHIARRSKWLLIGCPSRGCKPDAWWSRGARAGTRRGCAQARAQAQARNSARSPLPTGQPNASSSLSLNLNPYLSLICRPLPSRTRPLQPLGIAPPRWQRGRVPCSLSLSAQHLGHRVKTQLRLATA